MFDHLDDPLEPAAAPLDGVVQRGRNLRFRRRAIIASAGAAVLAVALATAAALPGGAREHKVVLADPTTTVETPTSLNVTDSSPAPTTNAPNDSSTAPTTDPGPPTSVVPPQTLPPQTLPPDTQPSHDPHDYSKITAIYDPVQTSAADGYGIIAGATRNVTYTLTNNGSWDVEWVANPCPVELSTIPEQGTWAPYNTVWPRLHGGMPIVAICDGLAALVTLKGGESRQFNATLVAGQRDARGNVFPDTPGTTTFMPPPFTPCDQPCDWQSHQWGAAVLVYPPDPPNGIPYTFSIADSTLHAASGASVEESVTYTNALPFTVDMPVPGPCWSRQSGAPAQIDCSGDTPIVTVGPNATVVLKGTVYARKGFAASGAPLAPGTYRVSIATALADVANEHVTLTVT